MLNYTIKNKVILSPDFDLYLEAGVYIFAINDLSLKLILDKEMAEKTCKYHYENGIFAVELTNIFVSFNISEIGMSQQFSFGFAFTD